MMQLQLLSKFLSYEEWCHVTMTCDFLLASLLTLLVRSQLWWLQMWSCDCRMLQLCKKARWWLSTQIAITWLCVHCDDCKLKANKYKSTFSALLHVNQLVHLYNIIMLSHRSFFNRLNNYKLLGIVIRAAKKRLSVQPLTSSPMHRIKVFPEKSCFR